MFYKNYQILFLFFLITGTLMAISSSSWILSWLGLEVNLMSLIPLILSELNFKSTEAAIKYFLAQALASAILVASASIMTLQEMSFIFNNFNTIIFFSLAIKAGLAPFHFWFPQVMKYISWLKNIVILVWQKIAPFILMSCFNKKPILFLILISCAFTGALGGLNITDSKLILTYSSIAHSAWMVMLTFNSSNQWLLYFSIYSLLVTPIIVMLKKFNLSKITELNKSKMNSMEKIFLSFMVMSLGGLPPFAGFAAKLYAILLIIKMSSMATLFILISSSLVSLFFYTKLFYNLLTKSTIESKVNHEASENPPNKNFLLPVIFNLSASALVLLS